ncbi:hypothetical protein [Bradyrhizobium sp.]|uniref:hypothetical protein n=1 Tax=Bradyrhizobium sp. TaxID=376 RepID=UPI003C7C7F49
MQRIYDFGTSDVAAMNDVIDASQATLRLRPEQPVRVGDDPDPEGHRSAALSALGKLRFRPIRNEIAARIPPMVGPVSACQLS